MIYLYSGTPGSGKSLDTARVIYHTLARNRPVICNFEINTDYVKHSDKFYFLSNTDLTPSKLIEFSREYFGDKPTREGQILLVIDECQLLFNARDWQQSGRQEWLSFYTQHRKYGYDIILVAQFDRMIDRQIRSLIEYEIVHRKVSNFGPKGILLTALMGGRKLFVRVKVWYPMQEKTGSNFFHAQRKYYRLYNTYNNFSASDVACEKG